MKRVLLLSVLAFAAIGLSAQTVGGTWIDPSDANNQVVPGTVPGKVTSGLQQDEIDAIVHNPLALSAFKGISIYTAYMNMNSWMNPANNPTVGTSGNTTNPFVLNDADIVLGNFMLGMGLPLFESSRLGFLLGYKPTNAGGLGSHLVGATNGTTFTSSTTTTTDATGAAGTGNPDGTSESVVTVKKSLTDSTVGANYYLVAGANLGNVLGDIGPLALGVRVKSEGSIISLGGSDVKTTAVTEAQYPASTLLNNPDLRAVYYNDIFDGSNTSQTDGGVSVWSAPSTTTINVLGQVGMNVGFELPLSVMLGWDSSTTALNRTVVPVVYVAKNSFAANNSAAKVTTMRVTQAANLTAGWLDIGYQAPSSAFAYLGSSTATMGAASALDPTKSAATNNQNKFQLKLAIDPRIPSGDIVTFRPRVGLDLDIGGKDSSKTYFLNADYSQAQATFENLVWSARYSSVTPQTDFDLNWAGEIGSAIDFVDPTKTLQLSLGVLFNAKFTNSWTTKGTAVQTVTRSFTNPDTAATAVVPAAAAPTTDTDALIATQAALVGAATTGAVTGSSTYTKTTTYTGNSLAQTTTLKLNLPVAVTIKASNALSFGFGYIATMTAGSSSTSNNEIATSTTTGSVTPTGGAAVSYTSVKATTTTTMVGDVTAAETTAPVWSGKANFLVRLKPIEAMTIDLEGAGIMNALNFNILGGGAGFNPNTFLSSLTLSVGFRF